MVAGQPRPDYKPLPNRRDASVFSVEDHAEASVAEGGDAGRGAGLVVDGAFGSGRHLGCAGWQEEQGKEDLRRGT
jgi:hypothetical protein